MKEIIGKNKIVSDILPSRITEHDIEYKNKKDISEIFNHFFVNTGLNLPSKIKGSETSFQNYFNDFDSSLPDSNLTFDELETAIKSIKKNKAPGIDDISGNVVLYIFSVIRKPIFNIFSSSIKNGIVPDKLKIAKIVPIFKGGGTSAISSYRPISILPIFSKLLERTIYNRLYKF
ncbi:uncharacterized protein LOC136096171 [Hydra vulgaris]|uniref:uncharacterized protein LOC136096171 n=1 Tax=Hydra vulgaris TaxID=6087 RepID=UPI0032E9D5D1